MKYQYLLAFTGVQFQMATKRVYYVAFVLCCLLFLERQFVVSILIAVVFLFYCYQWEPVIRNHKIFRNSPQNYIKKIALVCFEFLKLGMRWMLKDKGKIKETLKEKNQVQSKPHFWGDMRQHDFGRKNLLKLFPEKTWLKIFGELKDSKDVMSCYYTCKLFHVLLETRMMAEGFLVLTNYLETHSTRTFWLQNDDILNCRLVSSSWKLSIDYFFQHNPSHMNFLGHSYPTTIIDSNDSKHVEGLIQRLIRNYHFINTNPFPSRHMQLRIHSDLSEDDKKIFFMAMSIIMKYFGRYLWYFTIYIDDADNDAVATYQSVCKFLGQTPSLKMISLCFLRNIQREQASEESGCVEDALVSKAFGNLKNLSALKFENVHDSIINSVLKEISNVEKLEVVPRSN